METRLLEIGVSCKARVERDRVSDASEKVAGGAGKEGQ